MAERDLTEVGAHVTRLSGGSAVPRVVNSPWTREELILALDVYFRHGAASTTHPSVLELRDLLQVVCPKDKATDREKFGNANSVAMMLGKLHGRQSR